MSSNRIGKLVKKSVLQDSSWELIYSITYRKLCLHTDGPTYIHDFGNKFVSCWYWDSRGLATHVRKTTKTEMFKLITNRKWKIC